jgi:hypothetical protein
MTMETEHDETMMGDMDLTAASTTIDPSVVQSRIRQSASLQQEDDMTDDQPVFPKLSAAQASGNKVEYRRVRCPPHRYTPLREHWEQILTPLVEYLKLQVRTQILIRCFSTQLRYDANEEMTQYRNVHCVVPRNSNPPGSLNGIKNDAGRPEGRCLMHLVGMSVHFWF